MQTKRYLHTLALLLMTTVFFGFDTENTGDDFVLVRPQKNIKVWNKNISFLGSAPADQNVAINDQTPRRNKSGHFAAVMPLKDNENFFKIKTGNQTDTVSVIKLTSKPRTLKSPGMISSTITPSADIEIMPNEYLYLSVMASPGAKITVDIGGFKTTLKQAGPATDKDLTFPVNAVKYEEYLSIPTPLEKTKAVFSFDYKDTAVSKSSKGKIKVLNPNNLKSAVIKDPDCILRTGPSTSFGRLSPLPLDTTDYITKRDGQWLRLKYGGWIKEKYVEIKSLVKPDTIKISAIDTNVSDKETNIFFKLNYRVPFTVTQEDKYIKINFYGAAHQTDVIRIKQNATIENIIWVPSPATNSSYILTTVKKHNWGYDYKYKDNTLVLSIKHPPVYNENNIEMPLKGISVFLDAGHGGKDPGAIGPTGYKEKTATLSTALKLKESLVQKGATIIMSRETDTFLKLRERVNIIKETKPDVALSIHYNANSLDTNSFDIQGISTHWYQPHSAALANFLHNTLTTKLKAKPRGVFWQTLFMTRVTTCPSVLLELGFITHPDEFDKIKDEAYQKEMAEAVAETLTLWLKNNS